MNREKNLSEYTYPQIYKRIMNVCEILCIGMIVAVVLRYGIKNCKMVCVLLFVMLLFVIFIKEVINKYKIIVSSEGLKMVSFIGKAKNIEFGEIGALRKKANGSIQIICKDGSMANIDISVEGYEQICDLLQREFNARK